MSIGKALLNAPFPEMVKNLGVGIATAQFELDKVSLKITQFMAGMNDKGESDPKRLVLLKKAGAEPEVKYSLLGLGFTPTFYQFVDTVIELKMSVNMSVETSASISTNNKIGGGLLFFSASVNAEYSQKYQYSAEGSSLMRTKLVTVPAPAILEEIIRQEVLGQTGS